MTLTRQDQYSVTVAVDGLDTGVWDTLTGGEMDSEETKYKPGAMSHSVSLGGNQEPGNVTVSRAYDLDRDHSIVKTLLAKAGRAACVVKKQPLDRDAVAFGAPLVYTGVLKAVTPPEHDSESSDAGMLEMEISVDGDIG